MAIGVVTNHGNIGNHPGAQPTKLSVVDIVGAASYTTGGDTITPAAVGLDYIFGGWTNISACATAGATTKCTSAAVLPQPDGTAKLICFQQSSTAAEQQECVSAGSIAGVTIRCYLVGR